MSYTLGDTPGFQTMTETVTGQQPTFVQPGVSDPIQPVYVACWDGSTAASASSCPTEPPVGVKPSSGSASSYLPIAIVGGIILLIAMSRRRRR